MNLTIRDYNKSNDENLIYSSWLHSARCRCDFVKLPNSVFFPNYKRLIGAVLENNQVLVACHKDDPSHVIGYIIFRKEGEGKILYFAYTKFTYRKLGVFKRLLHEAFGAEGGIIFTTHRSQLIDDISKRYELVYNPFLFWGEK